MERKDNQQTTNPDDHQMGKNQDKPDSRSRRKALKTIAAGTAVAGTMALTARWSKPVMNSIILPAHAQATNSEPPPVTTTPAPTTTGDT